MSLAEGNVAEANRAALEAQNNLPDNALPLLLAAQAARMDSNHRLAEEKYKALIALPAPTSKQNNPKELGYRGLFSMALAEGKKMRHVSIWNTHSPHPTPKINPSGRCVGFFQIEAGEG